MTVTVAKNAGRKFHAFVPYNEFYLTQTINRLRTEVNSNFKSAKGTHPRTRA